MNTKSGRREMNGLIVWKKFNRELSPEETEREITAMENEGFEVKKVLNSDTILVGITSDGQNFSKSHLRRVELHWKRLIETHVQLAVLASRVDHKILEEWE